MKLKDNSILLPNSIEEIIKKSVNRKCSFENLDSHQKNIVLMYIKEKSIDCKVFGERGFDVLKQLFFADEYLPGEDARDDCLFNTIQFDSFTSYFEYLKGDIFKNACYFGYQFSKEDLNKIGKTTKRLNKLAYTKDKIDNYSFKEFRETYKKEIDDTVKLNKEMEKRLNESPSITTYESLIKQYSNFHKTFYGKNYDECIFFQYAINNNGEKMEEAAIKFASKYYGLYCYFFQHVLIKYGYEAAQKVLDDYNISDSTSKVTLLSIKNYHNIIEYKKIIELFKSNDFQVNTYSGFNSYSKSQTYYVRKYYYYEDETFMRCEWIFLSFDEMVLFLDGDLSNCKLKEAPIYGLDFSKYKTNSNTSFPQPNFSTEYSIKKGYDGNVFFVNEFCFDDYGKQINCHHNYFSYFCDFFYFVNGDLSDADMIMCEGIENILSLKNVKFNNIKVRSNIAIKLGLNLNLIPQSFKNSETFRLTERCELESINSYLEMHDESEEYYMEVTYVTDIHLNHKYSINNCVTKEDVEAVNRNISNVISNEFTKINLIGGDIASDPFVYENFVENLAKIKKKGMVFVTLGNHELWGFEGEKLEVIVAYYQKLLSENGMYLLHDNLFIFTSERTKQITKEELESITESKLRLLTKHAKLIIFGGIGYAGRNDKFNANSGMYKKTISRDQEILLSIEFDKLYEKVAKVLYDKNVIVLTHMPFKDWSSGNKPVDGFVYVSGHNHLNYYHDDGKERIYSDNQIGYNQKNVNLKKLSVKFDCDYFSDFQDGIHEISKSEYERFYKGINEKLTFNRKFDKLYLLKREKSYMFLMRSFKGSLYILNGGAIKNTGIHNVQYYYDNLSNYSKSINMFLSKYDDFQKSVSKSVKAIGGSGNIHGSIIDIDFYNHLYLNPLDGTVIPYFAYSIVDKYVFKNIPSLLKEKCPDIFLNYQKLIQTANAQNVLVKACESSPIITSKSTYVSSTEMYKISRILKGLQFTTKYKIVRLWNDTVVADCSEENGRLLIRGIFHPEEIEMYHKNIKQQEKMEKMNNKSAKVILSPDEKQHQRINKYIDNVAQKTSNIEVVEYVNSRIKATYKCKSCGHIWSARSDHFKDQQKSKCPICKK